MLKIKEKLIDLTSNAFEKDIFGAPTFVVNNKIFWGQDRLDYALDDKWFLNVDVKKLFLQTDVTVNATNALGATVGADVDINPWLLGFGIGYKF